MHHYNLPSIISPIDCESNIDERSRVMYFLFTQFRNKYRFQRNI